MKPRLTFIVPAYNSAATLIQTLSVSHWLVFWAILPVLGQMVLRALVLTVINLDDQGHPV